MTLLIDVFLVVSILLVAWLGWNAGITRSFFAALAGFLAMFAVSVYPYKAGMNVYIVFIVAALFVFLIGAFVLRLVRFFFLNLLDKFVGMAFGVVLWLIVSVNIVVPTLAKNLPQAQGAENTTVYKSIASVLHTNVPQFGDFVPSYIKNKTNNQEQ